MGQGHFCGCHSCRRAEGHAAGLLTAPASRLAGCFAARLSGLAQVFLHPALECRWRGAPWKKIFLCMLQECRATVVTEDLGLKREYHHVCSVLLTIAKPWPDWLMGRLLATAPLMGGTAVSRGQGHGRVQGWGTGFSSAVHRASKPPIH